MAASDIEYGKVVENGRCAIIYMIDPPHLVSPSVALLLSLRKHHQNATIIPYVPKSKFD